MPKDAPVDDLNLLELDAVEASPKLQPFAPTELIACEACGRSNAPTRTTCIYCGENLATTGAAAVLTPVPNSPTEESLESGLILATSDTKEIDEEHGNKLSTLLSIEADVLRSGISAGGPLPLLRPETVADANKISADLLSAGIQITIISDQELDAATNFRKIRSLDFNDDAIAASPNSDADYQASFAEVVLIVTGRVVTNRVEIEEKRRRRSARPIGSRQFIADESVMDIYTRTNAAAWRIHANSFDFSCLGSAKRMTGFENFATLISLFGERCPNIILDHSYYRKRAVLETVWPVEKTDKSELRLAGLGKINVSNITTSDNESQFNKYSALAWRVRMKALEGA